MILSGRRGVVVGVSGARSLGWEIACALAGHGAELAVTCRPARRAAVAPLAEDRRFALQPLDADDEATVAAAFAALGRAWGKLDFLVHTLVHVPEGLLARPLLDVTRADFDRVVGTAAHSLVSLCRAARPLLAASAAPRVVTLTSACARRMTPRYHVAGIGKAALEAAVIYLAQELGPDGILVNAVSAPILATEGAERAVGAQAIEATRARIARRAATARAGEAGDVADCVAWLVSPLLRNVTGEVVATDGGFALTYP